MENHRRHIDSTTISGNCSKSSAYPNNSMTHSMDADNIQHPSFSSQNFYHERMQNFTNLSHFSSLYHSTFKGAPYIPHQTVTAATPSEASAPVTSVSSVYINPNYRPKAVPSSEKERSLCRAANVHVNPHWKRRLKPHESSEVDCQVRNVIPESTGKKIFLNPKVLDLTMRDSLSKPVLNYHSSDNDTSSTGVKVVPISGINRNICNPELNYPSIAMEEPRNSERGKEPSGSCSESEFVVLNSRKLIRRPDTNSQQNGGSQAQDSFSSPPKVSEKSKNTSTSCASAVKIAKQLRSKYKLVRSCSSPISSRNFKGASGNSLRRSRRKSSNSKVNVPYSQKSLYKYVRKSGSTENGAVKQAKQTCQPLIQMKRSLCKDVSTFNQTRAVRESLSNPKRNLSSNKNMKTRYKLIRMPSLCEDKSVLAQENNLKAFKSRYKLVRDGLRGNSFSHTSHSLRQFSVDGVRATQPVSKSHIRISKNFMGSRSSQRRKVSRYRVIHAPGNSKIKNKVVQQIFKISGNYHHSFRKKSIWRPQLYGNIIWQKGRGLPSSHLKVDRRTSLCLTYNSGKRRNSDILVNKTSNNSLINIGGVLYSSTRTTLTRTEPKKSKEQIVLIRGRRFVLDAKGATLRPASNFDKAEEIRSTAPIARIDFGGVTFTRRSDNTLVRTNTHQARNLLSQAKIKSIFCLTQKLRKNNQPCLIYHRFGKCHAHEGGKCWRLHDPKNIAICQKFLQGRCNIENCLLSHAVGPEKMPTCKYFLEGCCVRDNCPYLHVKLNTGAAICRQFLDGYCEAGDKCKKRHVFLCPDFEHDKKCRKGKYCPYPHKDNVQIKTKKQKTAPKPKNVFNMKTPVEASSSLNTEKRSRYYYDNGNVHCKGKFTKESPGKILDSNSVGSDDEHMDEQDIIVGKRPKIEALPSYIPLNLSESSDC